MELKLNPNGKVAFMLKCGKDFTRGEMLEAEAKEIIRKGKVKEENGKIIVDNRFIFTDANAEEDVAEKVEPKLEEKKEQPKKEPPKKAEPKKEAKSKKDVPLKEAVKKNSKKKLVDDADKKPLSDKPLTRKKRK